MARIVQERRYISVTTTLTPEAVEQLEALAQQYRVSRAEIIRAAISDWLPKRQPLESQPTP